jgi:hypothetical protein
MNKFLVALVVFASTFVAPISAQAACTSTKSSGSVKVGSTITNGSVIVCAATGSTSAKTTAKVTTNKVATPVKVAPPPPCIIKVPNATAAYGLYVPGCSVVIVAPVAKVTTKVTASTAITNTNLSDQAAFTPNPIGISASPAVGAAGQAFFFSAIAAAHSKSGTVLGRSAQVNFVPVAFDWSSDTGGGSGSSFSEIWSSEGSHGVALTVSYSVSYSVGAGWIDAGTISSSASASVQVVGSPVAQVTVAPPPLLVSANCRDHPSSYRC